jgi:hypothetical protein
MYLASSGSDQKKPAEGHAHKREGHSVSMKDMGDSLKFQKKVPETKEDNNDDKTASF